MKIEVEIPILRVIAIRRDSPAWKAIVDAIPIQAGQIIPVTAEQLESLKVDCLILDVLPPETTKPQPKAEA